MTQHNLRSILEAFVTLINEWNDLQYEEGERGRGNNALVLEFWDDGSGRVSKSSGEAWDYHEGELRKISDTLLLNPQFHFKDLDELEAYLSEWLEVELGEIAR